MGNEQISVSQKYIFRAGEFEVIKNYDLINKVGQHKLLFYAEHIEQRNGHKPYFAIWVNQYTEEEMVKGSIYNKIYKLRYNDKPAVLFIRKESILNPPLEDGDVFSIGLGIVKDKPSYVLKIIKKHGTFVPHLQKEIMVYK